VSGSAEAIRVLVKNWRGLYTVPAPGLYPHQWSWDSGFIAFGLRHISPRRAQQELESLFSAQWADGRLPQIVFAPDPARRYSPGTDFWASESIAGSSTVPTAGLVQPPIHAWSALAVYRTDPLESKRRGFLARCYPRLVRWHDYLRHRRVRGSSGLASIVHPWESGMDNSPAWDAFLKMVPSVDESDIPRPDLERVSANERPSNSEYGKYLHLAARYRDHGCDDRDTHHPFLAEDPAFNAIWARSEWALAEIAQILGHDEEAHRNAALVLTSAIEELWNESASCYTARDVRLGTLGNMRTIAGLVPLILPGVGHVPELLGLLDGKHFQFRTLPLTPSFDLLSGEFDVSRYWRGPAWFNTAWLIAQGLLAHGRRADAAKIGAEIERCALLGEYPEYVNPFTAEPHGARGFSWTASLSLDLAISFGEEKK
jgi:hypothetical protein